MGYYLAQRISDFYSTQANKIVNIPVKSRYDIISEWTGLSKKRQLILLCPHKWCIISPQTYKPMVNTIFKLAFKDNSPFMLQIKDLGISETM